jgi:hypothetical protein
MGMDLYTFRQAPRSEWGMEDGRWKFVNLGPQAVHLDQGTQLRKHSELRVNVLY